MKFRIVFIGSTKRLTEIWEAAREVNETAVRTYLGMICPDDCIEADVNSVEEGKALMKKLYDKIDCFPKYYSWTNGDRFWNDNVTRYLGHDVYSDRFELKKKPKDYEYDIESEHFENFLEH